MGQVTFITGSVEDEVTLLSSVDGLMQAGFDIETKILPVNITPEELKNCIVSSSSDAFIVASNRIVTLVSYIASFTERPVIGIPLKTPYVLYNIKGLPAEKGYRFTLADDIETATRAAIKAVTTKRQYRYSA